MSPWIDVKVILATCSLFTACGVWFWNWKRTRKSLGYDFWTAPLLARSKHSLSGRVALTLDGSVIEHATEVIMRIKNTGYLPIERKDFDIPITVSFDKPTRILSARLTQGTPEDLLLHNAAELSIEEQSVRLSALLLNPGDEFTLITLVSNVAGKPRIHGRIVGVKALTRLSSYRNLSRRQAFYSSLLLGTILGINTALLVSNFLDRDTNATFLFIFMAILFGVRHFAFERRALTRD